MRKPTVVLIACGAKKLSAPTPAGDLYQGSLFRKARAAALMIGDDFRIVSALHGLLDPRQVIAPYNVALNRSGGTVRTEDLAQKIAGPIRDLQTEANVVALLPGVYAKALPSDVENLMPNGLPIGRMLQWLTARATGADSGALDSGA